MNNATLIIVCYNSYSIIQKCMDPLLQSGRYRILMIDNASTDGSVESLKKDYRNVEIIALNQNIGYGRAANVGLNMTQTDYALLLNPDLCVTPENVGQLLDIATKNKGSAAVFSPAVKKEEFTRKGCLACDWVSGSAMLFDLAEMKSIGWFDENIFLFWEESDLCMRIKQAGKKILLCTDVYFQHLKGKGCTTSPEIDDLKNWHFGWSKAYYHKKHELDAGKNSPLLQFFMYKFKSLTTNQTRRLKHKARANGTKAFLQGLAAFDFNGRPIHITPFKK